MAQPRVIFATSCESATSFDRHKTKPCDILPHINTRKRRSVGQDCRALMSREEVGILGVMTWALTDQATPLGLWGLVDLLSSGGLACQGDPPMPA